MILVHWITSDFRPDFDGSGDVLVESDFEDEEAFVLGQLGTVWSDSSRIGGGRLLWTTKLIAPQSDIFGDSDREFGVVLCRFRSFDPSDDEVWLKSSKLAPRQNHINQFSLFQEKIKVLCGYDDDRLDLCKASYWVINYESLFTLSVYYWEKFSISGKSHKIGLEQSSLTPWTTLVMNYLPWAFSIWNGQ